MGLTSSPSNEGMDQSVVLSNMTSSKTGTFYLAFGSNLSAYQMSLRLKADPMSSRPVAIARLDSYAWIICERGYANVVPVPESNAASNQNTVWGVLYNLSAQDEAQLDKYEGHDSGRNSKPEINPDPQSQQVRPYLQGGWDYNKLYLPLTVTKWLENPHEFGVETSAWSRESVNQETSIRALVYVDEFRTKPGEINQEYIGRMNRAIRESTALGVPSSWVEKVLRKFVPADIEVDSEGYVGTDEGYVEAEATETSSVVKENAVKDAQTKSNS